MPAGPLGVGAAGPDAGQRQGPDRRPAQPGPRAPAQDPRAPGPDPHRHEADRRGHAPQVPGRPVPQGADHPPGPRRASTPTWSSSCRRRSPASTASSPPSARAGSWSWPPPIPLNVMALDDLRRATGLDVDFRIGPGRRHPGGHREDVPQASRRPVASEGLDDALKMDLGLSVATARRHREHGRHPAAAEPGRRSAGRAGRQLRARPGRRSTAPRTSTSSRTTTARASGTASTACSSTCSRSRASSTWPWSPGIKIISRLDIAERRLPQDGSFASRIHGQEFDFRVSTLPTIYGEKVVLRLLEKAAVVERYSIENLGFEKEQLEVFLKGIRRPWGMVLLTGPTGSGKSTTLHTAHQVHQVAAQEHHHRRGPGRVPPAGHPAGAGQERDRLRLRALRCAPSCARTRTSSWSARSATTETAQIAVKAALTGHLVLSTLHTNDAVSTLVRLINIGVEPFLVASAVNVAAAQRLVRRICKDCKESYRPTPGRAGALRPRPRARGALPRARAARAAATSAMRAAWRSTRCSRVDAEVRRMVIDGADGDKIQRYAVESGMITLRQCGFRQAARGLTTLEEVLAVAADDGLDHAGLPVRGGRPPGLGESRHRRGRRAGRADHALPGAGADRAVAAPRRPRGGQPRGVDLGPVMDGSPPVVQAHVERGQPRHRPPLHGPARRHARRRPAPRPHPHRARRRVDPQGLHQGAREGARRHHGGGDLRRRARPAPARLQHALRLHRAGRRGLAARSPSSSTRSRPISRRRTPSAARSRAPSPTPRSS